MNEYIPVFLSSDDNYAPFVAITIASICYNTSSFIDFYILDGGISVFHKRQIESLKEKFDNFSIEFINIDINKVFKNFQCKTDGITLSTYNKFLLPQLKPNIKRAIYSDVDVIVLGDIVEFYEQELHDHEIGSVRHAFYDFDSIVAKSARTRMALSSTHKYFYAGNLLIDCDKWRSKNISDNLFSIEKMYRARHIHGDQDILNKYFMDNYESLDNRFCATTQDMECFSKHNPAQYANLLQHTIIRHFESRSKPWLTDVYKGRPLDNFIDFWFFAAMTPFYAGLQQQFVAAQSHSEIYSYKCGSDVKQPNKAIFDDLRARLKNV